MKQLLVSVVICHSLAGEIDTGVRIFDVESYDAALYMISVQGLGRYSKSCYRLKVIHPDGEHSYVPLFQKVDHQWRPIRIDFGPAGVYAVDPMGTKEDGIFTWIDLPFQGE